MPKLTGVSHVELTVRDAPRSASWYEAVLQMRRIAEHESSPTPGVAARIVNLIHPSGLSLGLITHQAGDSSPFSELRVGLDHLALAVETRDELETWVDHLDEHDVPHSPIQDMSYGSVLVFRDPDNIQLELFAWSGSL